MGFISSLLGRSLLNENFLSACANSSFVLAGLEQFIKDGANPKIAEYRSLDKFKPFSGFTPLHYICYASSLEQPKMVKLLLAKKINSNALTRFEATPLHIIAANPFAQQDSWEALLSAKTNVNAVDSTGMTALHYAVQSANLELVTRLIKSGADVNYVPDRGKNYDGNPPIHSAVLGCERSDKCIDIIKLLLENKASTDLSGPQKKPVFMFTAQRFDRVKGFCDAGAGQEYIDQLERLDKVLNLFKEIDMKKSASPKRSDNPDDIPPPLGGGDS